MARLQISKRFLKGRLYNLCSIDFYMLPSKLAYFMQAAGFGHALYITVFLTSVGLTSGEAGLITGISYLTSAVATPLWGFIADYTGKRHVIFYVIVIGACVTTFSFPWVAFVASPRNEWRTKKELNNNSKLDSKQLLCSGNNVHFSSNGTTRICSGGLQPFQSTVFFAMFGLNIVSFMFVYPIGGVLDSITMNIIENYDKDVNYGNQRAFGSISYGVSNLLAGYVSDTFQIAGMSKYTGIFIVFLAFEILLIPLGMFLFRKTSWSTETKNEYVRVDSVENEFESENTKTDKNKQIKALQKTLNNTGNMIFLLTVLVIGLLRQISFPFLFLLMKDEMHATHTAMGLASFVGTVTEFLMFPFANEIIETIGSPMRCIQIGLLGYIVRLLGISYVTNQWVMTLPQLLDGPSFALFWAGSVEYIRRICQEEIHTTMYTILTGLLWGLSACIRSIAGGFLYHTYGGPVLYRGTAVFGVVWGMILFNHFEVLPYCKRYCTKREDEKRVEGDIP